MNVDKPSWVPFTSQDLFVGSCKRRREVNKENIPPVKQKKKNKVPILKTPSTPELSSPLCNNNERVTRTSFMFPNKAGLNQSTTPPLSDISNLAGNRFQTRFPLSSSVNGNCSEYSPRIKKFNFCGPTIGSTSSPLCPLSPLFVNNYSNSKLKTNDTNVAGGISKTLFTDDDSSDFEVDVDYENIETSQIADYSSTDDECDSVCDDEEIMCNVKNVSETVPSLVIPPQYCSLGLPTEVCFECQAIMWKEERSNKNVKKGKPIFSFCCRNGRVKLPVSKPTPPFLQSLYTDKVIAPHFRKKVRLYNSMFSFTSMGGHVDHSVNKGRGPYVYKLNGQNHHNFGSLLPHEGESPKFCQLYIYDTENEISNRFGCVKIKDPSMVDEEIVKGILKMLDEINSLVKVFRMARDRFKDQDIIDLKIFMKQSRSESGRENHISPSNEVAALMVGDLEDTCGQRDIVIDSKTEGLKRISDIHPLLMALQYPLLFPYGEDGYHEKLPLNVKKGSKSLKRKTVTMREYYSHKLQVRTNEGMTLRLGGRLYQQFMVDAFSAIEQSRLWWFRCHQTKLRNELYHHIVDYVNRGDGDTANVGQSFVLPSSFVGSKRYMQQNFHDALAVCRFVGHPALFLTMTCNPMWDEVLKMMSLLPLCRIEDCPDIIARVFKLKLTQLIDDIKKKNFFGKCTGVMYVIEYQKRGLPHVHLLIWLDDASKRILDLNIDKWVCAEIPDPELDPSCYAAVKAYMIHGPCGLEFPNSPCMKAYKCSRHFPKRYCSRTMFDQSGFPIYMRRRTNNFVQKNKAVLDNQWVVPYNRDLLLRYQCHINIEVCAFARSVKYLFKYCLKGPDRATVLLKSDCPTNSLNGNAKLVDEIKTYLDGRYVCGAEAAHRIFGFDMHYRSISVERLPFHLPGDKCVTFIANEILENVCRRAEEKLSKLEAFFELNQFTEESRQYTYEQIPQFYIWDKDSTCWFPRKKGRNIGRLCYTHHTSGELWYLRILLCRIAGPTSFQHLRTVKDVVYDTYQEACLAYGFLDDDKEWHASIEESSKIGFPFQIRELFVHIMVNCQVSDLKDLWLTHWRCMSEDILYQKRKKSGYFDLQLSEQQLEWYTLCEIDKLLKSVGKCLKKYKQMPLPPSNYLDSSLNNLIEEETSYDKVEMLELHNKLLNQCNEEQKQVYNTVLDSVNSHKGGVYFVYGSGGCGKTYLWKTIISRLRSEGKIVLPVASSGIASTLMPNGRTAHSRFKIPILLDDFSSCAISHKSDIAELLKKTSLIIWDEAPMQHRYAFECLDRSLRDILKSVDPVRCEEPFGGITMLFGGDFRQILPVIPQGSRSDIVSSCITRSRLWRSCRLFILKENMRLIKGSTLPEVERMKSFAKWVLDIGDGKIKGQATDETELCEDDIQIPPEYCISSNQKSIDDIIDCTYPDLVNNFNCPKYLSERAILTPTNQTVDHLNSIILDKLPGPCFTYYSVDKAEEVGCSDDDINTAFPMEYLNSIKLPGMPPHDLKMKVGVVVMLTRNLNQTLGLCNGTRMIVKKCMKHTVLCEVIAGTFVGSRHFIPRMDLCPSDSKLPFKLLRKQMPLQICFAMTINKSQGQSLDNVGLYLPNPVFCHGQLYVAVSRVTSPEGLRVLIDSDDGNSRTFTKNVVYEEVFYNLPSV